MMIQILFGAISDSSSTLQRLKLGDCYFYFDSAFSFLRQFYRGARRSERLLISFDG